jgi:hypothetical protein
VPRLARHDLVTDTVHLLQEAFFVPHGDWARMIAFFLGDSVIHLRAATANVLGDIGQELEQAIFELSNTRLHRPTNW